MFRRFMKWWRSPKTYKDRWDTEQVTPMVAVRPKTRVEIARDILTKYDFCPIHLVEKTIDSKVYFSEYKYCLICLKERKEWQQMEETKQKAVKGIEIKFALDVLKGNSQVPNAPSS